MARHRIESLCGIGMGLLLFACEGGSANDPGGMQDTARAGEPLAMIGADWPYGRVPVCYESPNGAPVSRATLPNVAAANWPSVAEVDFFGWGDCTGTNGAPSLPNGTVGVQILGSILTPDWSGCLPFGYYSNAPNHLKIVENVIEPGYAGHEFGHALGFMHEMERQDFANQGGSCQSSSKNASDTLGTPPDPSGLMAATGYCNGYSYLDNWDMMGVQRAYGARRVINNGALALVNSKIYRNHPESARELYSFVNDSTGTRYAFWNGKSWSWVNRGQSGGSAFGAPSVTTFRATNGTRYVHAYSRNSNGTLAVQWRTGTTWSQGTLVGAPASEPSAVNYAAQDGGIRAYVFYKTSDGQLGVTWYDGGSWRSTYVDVGKTVAGRPSAVTTPNENGVQELRVFYRGTDNNPQMVWWDGTQWNRKAISTAANMGADPEAHLVISPLNGLRLYSVVFPSTSGGLQGAWYDGTSWHDAAIPSLALMSQRVTEASGIDTDGVRRAWVAGLGTNGNVSLSYSDGTSWYSYDVGRPTGTVLTGVPQVLAHETASGARRVNIFVTACNTARNCAASIGSRLYTFYWNGNAWQWGDLGW